MNHVTFLRFLNRGNKKLFDVGYAPQKEFIESFTFPSSDKDRSYYQYKCQSFFAPKWKEVLIDISSLFVFFPVLLFFFCSFPFVRNKNSYKAISDLGNMQEIIPESLMQDQEIHFCSLNVRGCLNLKGVCYLLSLFFNYLRSPYFTLKATKKVAQFCQLIKMYNPQSIIVHTEYSFTSSILTEYCQMNNIGQINVMHGEKLYNIGDAFFHFSKCYVWDDFYKELFCSLRAEPSQFIVYKPKSLYIDTLKYRNPQAWADYKYYLGPFNETEIKSIVASMGFAKAEGKTVKYRLHPRYGGLNIILKYVDVSEIEDPKKVSILESVSNCATAVGSYSTVLSQAFYSGKDILIDDVTYEKEYLKLKELKYWLIDKGCATISSKNR